MNPSNACKGKLEVLVFLPSKSMCRKCELTLATNTLLMSGFHVKLVAHHMVSRPNHGFRIFTNFFNQNDCYDENKKTKFSKSN